MAPSRVGRCGECGFEWSFGFWSYVWHRYTLWIVLAGIALALPIVGGVIDELSDSSALAGSSGLGFLVIVGLVIWALSEFSGPNSS